MIVGTAGVADLPRSQPAEPKTPIALGRFTEPTPPRSWASITIGKDVRKARNLSDLLAIKGTG